MKKKAVSALFLQVAEKEVIPVHRQIHPRGMRQTQQKVLHQI